MKKLTSRKGFTLIELLIVITIIGILAVALLPSVLGAPARARDAARKADMNNIIAALETFNSDHQHYPSDAGCVSSIQDGTGSAVMPPYFSNATPPKDPQGQGIGAKGAIFDSCKDYYYCPLSGNPASYAVASYMEVIGDANSKGGTDLPTCDGSVGTVTLTATDTDNHAYVVIK